MTTRARATVDLVAAVPDDGTMIASLSVVLALSAPPVQLQVDDTSAGACPPPEAVRARVVQLLGRDPFGDAGRVVRVQLRPAGRAFAAAISDGAAQREITAADCAELVPAAALAVAIAIDPAWALTPPAPPPPAPPASSRSTAPSAPTERLASDPATYNEPRPPLRLRIHGGAHAASGASPGVGGGAHLGLSLGRGLWYGGVEGRWDAPSAAAFRGGEVRADWIGGRALGCVGGERLDACLSLAAAWQRFDAGGFAVSQEGTGAYLAPGARGIARWPLSEALALRFQLDLDLPLSRTVLRVGGDRAWESAPLTAALGLGVEWR